MNRSHHKMRVLLFVCGVFAALPLLGSLKHSCSNPIGSECCGLCTASFSVDAQVHAGEPKAKKPPLSNEAKAALEKLLEGNRRFAAGKPMHKHTSLEWRAQVAKDQKPFAVMCSFLLVVRRYWARETISLELNGGP